MALERWFRRNKPTRKEEDNSPAGLWLKCDGCHAQIYRKDLVANRYVCPECDHHYRMPVDARIDLLADAGTFERWSGHIQAQDPLEFEDTQPYTEHIGVPSVHVEVVRALAGEGVPRIKAFGRFQQPTAEIG